MAKSEKRRSKRKKYTNNLEVSENGINFVVQKYTKEDSNEV